jgi:hypothetical protein
MTANPSGCSVLRTCSAAVLRAAAPGRCLTFSDSFLERQKNARLSCTSLAEASGTWQDHRITSSAWKRSVGGSVRPRACAVLRLITNSNFLGCSTGRSAGVAPLRILST